jgi:hypothetical protein
MCENRSRVRGGSVSQSPVRMSRAELGLTYGMPRHTEKYDLLYRTVSSHYRTMHYSATGNLHRLDLASPVLMSNPCCFDHSSFTTSTEQEKDGEKWLVKQRCFVTRVPAGSLCGKRSTLGVPRMVLLKRRNLVALHYHTLKKNKKADIPL